MSAVGKRIHKKVLSFEEEENGDLRTASERVRRLAPQIRYYRIDGFNWSTIRSSLVGVGINLTDQSLKNIVSSSADKSVMAPFSREQSRATGLEPARGRSNNNL